ncbi:serine/threonine-protein kinase HAL4/sat4 [Savitreella phatthalungensis]
MTTDLTATSIPEESDSALATPTPYQDTRSALNTATDAAQSQAANSKDEGDYISHRPTESNTGGTRSPGSSSTASREPARPAKAFFTRGTSHGGRDGPTSPGSASGTTSPTLNGATHNGIGTLDPSSGSSAGGAAARPVVMEHRESQSQTTTKKTISRLQRMFSQSGRRESSMNTKAHANSTTAADKDTSAYASDASAGTRTPDEHKKEEDRYAGMTEAEKLVARRFEYDPETGTHKHHLRKAKREEKLRNMLKDMLGGKAKREAEERQKEADEEHRLSLVTSWVDQFNLTDEAKLAKPRDAHSQNLVEKYGRCQEVIGRGAFGIVRISHKPDKDDPHKESLFAVKEFRRRPNETDKKYTKRLTSEFCISSSLRHPNVIHTLDLLQDAKGDYCEVMEFCAGGDLYTLILAAGKLEMMEADCYFKQLMRGVNYLHEMGVAHRDLKPENLLLTPSGGLKIADFGNGECFRMAWEKEAHLTAGLCGSAPYIAPEEYTEKEFGPAPVDVWACGVIYMAMRTGRHLWRMAKKDEDEFFARYLEGRKSENGYEPIEVLSRARCRNVIYSILEPSPRRRLTAKQVLDSEWCTGIYTCRAAELGL